MPWSETSPMDQRIEFIADFQRHLFSVSELCECFGISRKTADKWVARYQAQGLEGLHDRSCRPHTCPHETPTVIVQASLRSAAVIPPGVPRSGCVFSPESTRVGNSPPAVPAATPEEVLTDQGPQYHTWRGTSEFARLCARRGIRQVVARARHPQTLGKIERFWGTLWRECVERAVFQGLEGARKRIGLFIDYYNFQRTHQGLEGLVPADRYFSAAPQVLETLKKRVEANALDVARHGTPRQSVYLTGRVGEAGITVRAGSWWCRRRTGAGRRWT